ncbi:MAG: RNA polymerase sigma factor [Erysipelotrichaceae bacterium]|nr:RNA polymerase sigma factor [Erysipelotrichaceae bacterium]
MAVLSSEEIYRDYRNKVFSYIRSRINSYQDAEDLCEDVFVKVYQKYETYDDTKSKLSTWIFNITRNTVIDYYRTHKEELEIIDNYDYPEEPDDSLDEETLEELATALKTLSTELRDIIILHYYEGYTLKQVSEKMKMTYGITKLRHAEALRKLKKILKERI